MPTLVKRYRATLVRLSRPFFHVSTFVIFRGVKVGVHCSDKITKRIGCIERVIRHGLSGSQGRVSHRTSLVYTGWFRDACKCSDEQEWNCWRCKCFCFRVFRNWLACNLCEILSLCRREGNAVLFLTLDVNIICRVQNNVCTSISQGAVSEMDEIHERTVYTLQIIYTIQESHKRGSLHTLGNNIINVLVYTLETVYIIQESRKCAGLHFSGRLRNSGKS